MTDNFYDIGGDSIAAIQIAIMASENNIGMEANAVFEHQSIRELAKHVIEIQPISQVQPEDEPLIELGATDLDALAKQLSALE